MRKKHIDPYASREAQNYINPIPSREYLLDYLKEYGRLIRRRELVQELGLTDPEQQEALRRRLRAMERDGQIIFIHRKGYALPNTVHWVTGRVLGHKDGFGFLIADDKDSSEKADDLFLNVRQMSLVFHGDRVRARVSRTDKRGRREAVIVDILERNTHSVVGRFMRQEDCAVVIPVDIHISQTILITEGTAELGQMVVVEIKTQPGQRKQPTGRIIEVLGEPNAPGIEIELAMRQYGLPHSWPDQVLFEIATLSIELTEIDYQDRIDLRGLAFVTIDGEDARDFDDAVYCEPQTQGWRLIVAIADVSHYVKPHTALDEQAKLRGNSVYFSDLVIPMLPEVLSNELCSLKPQVDRLCMACDMQLSSLGQLQSYQFYPAIMHSRARLTYQQVTDFILQPHYRRTEDALISDLKNLHELYQKLQHEREKRGAIDFDTTETHVIFDQQRKIERIVPSERTVAHRMIEESMLLANVSASRYLLNKKIPALFRIHEGPSAAKLADLKTFLAELGLRLPGKKNPTSADYARLLTRIKHRPDKHLIQTVLLRSLSQAVYAPGNKGHFGLAFDAYTHFTSPIRRYSDLIVHRGIRSSLELGKPVQQYEQAVLVALGEHCSMTERRADDATQMALNWLKCEFMQDHIGQVYLGIITHITNFGLFVELQDIYVEGLVHVTALRNDHYQFDARKHHMRGERTGIVYRLGDPIKVMVARVDLERQKIDFVLN